MNRNDFLGMIGSNGPSDRHSTGEMIELLKIFPYCQTAHILVLKGLKNTSDVRFENQLRISAMHIADREVLYYYLQKESGSGTIVSETSAVKEEQPVKESIPPDDTEHEQTVIEAARNSADLILAIERDENPGKSAEGTTEGDSSKAHREIIEAEIDNDSSASVLIIDEDSGDVETKVIFMDPGFSASDDDTDLLEIESEEVPGSEISGNTGTEPLAAGSDSPGDDPSNVRRKTQADLIDKFIEANPRIEPVRVKSDAPVDDIAKQYTEHQGGFVTETLARIYVTQGYYSRAIDIYERLSLKFPEKSSYFATQIEKVKELIKK